MKSPETTKKINPIVSIANVLLGFIFLIGALALNALAFLIGWNLLVEYLGLPRMDFREAMGVALILWALLLPVLFTIRSIATSIKSATHAYLAAEYLRDIVKKGDKNAPIRRTPRI
jgi:hypothetical protein